MSRANKSCNVGDIVRIKFDDHGEGVDIFVFEAFGQVLKKTRRDIVIACWKYADDSEEMDHNCSSFIIIRSAIKEIEVLKAKEVKTVVNPA